jgi:hypothetical protein
MESSIKNKEYDNNVQQVEEIQDTSDVIKISDDSSTQDDELKWNVHLLVDKDKALSEISNDGESDEQEEIEDMTNDDLQSQAMSTNLTITHEDTKYTLLKMTRYYCTVCNTSYSLQSNCLSHVDTMHPELSTSYQHVEDKMTKVYQCETCRKMLPSLQSVHKHSSVCGQQSPTQSPTPEIQDNTKYKLRKEKRSVYECETCRKMIPLKSLYTHPSVCSKSQILDDEDKSDLIQNKTPEDIKYELKEVRQFKCNKCKKYFKTSQTCIDHFKATHSQTKEAWDYIDAKNIKMFACKKCDEVFPVQDLVVKHVNICVSAENDSDFIVMYKCKVCLNYFPTPQTECTDDHCTANKTHSMIMKKIIKCPVCEKLIPHENKYIRHFEMEHPDKDWCPNVVSKMRTIGMCHICPTWMTKFHLNNKLLAQHMLKHKVILSDKEIVAQVISRQADEHVTVRQSNIGEETNNMQDSSEEDDSSASECDDKLPTDIEQINFIKTERKVNACPVCTDIFSSAHLCRNHIKKHHSQENVDLLFESMTKKIQTVYICNICTKLKMFHNMMHLTEHNVQIHGIKLSDKVMSAQTNSMSNIANITKNTKKISCIESKVRGSKKTKQPITHTVETKNITTCAVCKKIFPGIQMCQKHIRTEHSHKDVQFLCSNVTKTLHEIYICHVCPGKKRRIFPDMTCLAQHMIKHNITLSDHNTPCSTESIEENITSKKHHQTKKMLNKDEAKTEIAQNKQKSSTSDDLEIVFEVLKANEK